MYWNVPFVANVTGLAPLAAVSFIVIVTLHNTPSCPIDSAGSSFDDEFIYNTFTIPPGSMLPWNVDVGFGQSFPGSTFTFSNLVVSYCKRKLYPYTALSFSIPFTVTGTTTVSPGLPLTSPTFTSRRSPTTLIISVGSFPLSKSNTRVICPLTN